MATTAAVKLDWTAHRDDYHVAKLGRLVAVVTRSYGRGGAPVWVWWVRRSPSIAHMAKGRGVATLDQAKGNAARYVRDLVRDWPGAVDDPVRPVHWGV